MKGNVGEKEFNKVKTILETAVEKGKGKVHWLSKDYAARILKSDKFEIGQEFIWKHWSGTCKLEIQRLLEDFIICIAV